MGPPAQLPQERRVQLLVHILNRGELKFHHWKPRNGTPQEPVPFERRWWADSELDPEQAAFEKAKQKALDARPRNYSVGPDDLEPAPAGFQQPGPSSAGPSRPRAATSAGSVSAGSSGPAAIPTTAAPAPPPPLPANIGAPGEPLVTHTSPYGSACAENVHDPVLSRADDLVDAPDFVFATIPDPDDILPPSGDLSRLDAPCSIPHNPESKAQWCFRVLQGPELGGRMPFTRLKSCIVALAELPVRRPHSYLKPHTET